MFFYEILWRIANAAEAPHNTGMSTESIEAFLEMMMASRGATKNSRESYAVDLHDFSEFYGKEINLADSASIEAWLANLHERDYAARSIARKTSAIRQYFRYLFEEGHREDNPTLQTTTPKQPKALPKLLSASEISTLLQHLAAEDSPKNIRMRALVELLYASGLRVSELVSLPLTAVHRLLKSGEPLLLVKGKGGKERIIPVNDHAIKALIAYLPLREHWLKDDSGKKWLFPSGAEQGYLNRQRFAIYLKQAAGEAGLNPQRISPHVLRHSFASHLLAGGADLRVIQELLGHAHLATTEIYTHLLPEKLRALVAQHPLAEE